MSSPDAYGKSERLAVLNRAEQEALYGLPDFDDVQRLEFLALACSRQELHAQICCILQIMVRMFLKPLFNFLTMNVCSLNSG